MARKLYLLGTMFYDDFPVFEVEESCKLATQVMDAFFNLVGWRHAVVGDKAVPFSKQVVALGVQYSLDQIAQGRFVVQNKPGRLDKIRDMLNDLESGEAISKAQAAVLGGLLNFAGGFVMGHSLKPACRMLAECAGGKTLNGRDKTINIIMHDVPLCTCT